MAKGLSVHHVCDCGHKANISKVVAARRNGTRCPKCGRNMQPSESGWETLSMANSAKLGYREPEKIAVVPMKKEKCVRCGDIHIEENINPNGLCEMCLTEN